MTEWDDLTSDISRTIIICWRDLKAAGSKVVHTAKHTYTTVYCNEKHTYSCMLQ